MLTLDTHRPAGPARYLSDSTELAAHPAAVGTARLHVRRVLRDWDLEELADDAELAVSEAMSNSVQAHQREHLSEPVCLTLLAGLRTLLIIVRDASDRQPVFRSPDLDAEDGRGLFLIDAIAARWDFKAVPGGGKALRIFLRCARPVPADHR